MSRSPELDENVSLATMNSLAVQASARWFAEARSGEELRSLLDVAARRNLATLILGGGSNLVW